MDTYTFLEILYIKWTLVVRSWWSSFFMYLQGTAVPYSTVLLYMCCKQEHKADHGHKKRHAPRAQERHLSTGISRPRTEVLRTRAYFCAANTLLRSRASRGHLNLYANQKDFLAASAVSLFAVSLRSLLFSLSRCLGRCLRLAARSFLATVDSKTDIVAAHCWILSPRLSSLHQTVLLEAPLNYKR